ncbi:hypothetical protein [Bacillus licheniformis]|uniref:hypothetical protein n=1 Tax=Bacillus licheniformis TaxID=1402 RepID=UPI00119E4676|nr:hypothetical protein [Bacillus licheniformis]MEC2105026.1 hypothetical protein [Bacillus licheniformis]TWK31249.1 hypothetical protein CHCC20369_3820 [Bacillus licheniformis]TWK41267.1 hypothetical protein CHCC20368_2366 [Bacillus licheniformis]
MKYYEIHEPYYALLAAEEEKKALEVYVEVVADDDGTLKDSIKEVSRQYALGCVGDLALKNKPELSVDKFVRDFNKRENDWLIIDGALA